MTISTVHKKEKTRKVGRPRSARVHRAILDATLELVAAEGIQGASIEAIAERAGVGKTAIYRRWESKEALVSDAINTPF
jgi:AcrR family transcriptional regulator